MTRYRVCYGNGQVSATYETLREAIAELDANDEYVSGRFIQFWDGDWFDTGIRHKAVQSARWR